MDRMIVQCLPAFFVSIFENEPIKTRNFQKWTQKMLVDIVQSSVPFCISNHLISFQTAIGHGFFDKRGKDSAPRPFMVQSYGHTV